MMVVNFFWIGKWGVFPSMVLAAADWHETAAACYEFPTKMKYV